MKPIISRTGPQGSAEDSRGECGSAVLEDFAREVIDAALDIKADLVVVGRHGRVGVPWNNTVKKVLKGVPCPVLVGA